MAKKEKDHSESKLFAFLGILLTVIGFVIVYATKKEDKYAMYYAKQGLVLFIMWVIAWILAMILAWIPVLGTILGWLLQVLMVVLWIIGLVYSLSGKEKDIPIVGTYANKF